MVSSYIMEDGLITIEDVAALFGVSTRQIRHYRALRIVKVAQVSHARQYFARSDVLKRKEMFDELRADGNSLEQAGGEIDRRYGRKKR